MDNGNIAVAKEVGLIESEQMADPVNSHCGDEAGIVNLRARNAVRNH